MVALIHLLARTGFVPLTPSCLGNVDVKGDCLVALGEGLEIDVEGNIGGGYLWR